MTRRLSFGDDFAKIVMDDTVAELVRDVIETSYGPLIARLQDEAVAIFEDAYAKWPVKTGKSRDTLRWALELRGDAVSAAVLVGTDYGHLIKGKPREAGGLGDEGDKQTWRVLLRAPLLAAQDGLIDDAAKLLAGT